MAALAPGGRVKILGPLGRGLDDAAPDFRARRWHLAAGGAGLGPMASLLDELGDRARLHYGERTAQAQVDRSFFESLAADRVAACEDGSGYGLRGRVTGPLELSLKEDPRPVLACGPPAMLAAAARLARAASVPFYASVEARMACGLGACLSCSLPLAAGGRIRACLDGPVVDGLSIDWEQVP
jgi:dihydroorotate dehydrogenase electron transfer subunit